MKYPESWRTFFITLMVKKQILPLQIILHQGFHYSHEITDPTTKQQATKTSLQNKGHLTVQVISLQELHTLVLYSALNAFNFFKKTLLIIIFFVKAITGTCQSINFVK